MNISIVDVDVRHSYSNMGSLNIYDKGLSYNHILIRNSSFKYGGPPLPTATTYGGGITIDVSENPCAELNDTSMWNIMYQSTNGTVIHIVDSEISYNNATNGGGMYIVIIAATSNKQYLKRIVHIENCVFRGNIAQDTSILLAKIQAGAADTCSSFHKVKTMNESGPSAVLTIMGTVFEHNYSMVCVYV